MLTIGILRISERKEGKEDGYWFELYSLSILFYLFVRVDLVYFVQQDDQLTYQLINVN